MRAEGQTAAAPATLIPQPSTRRRRRLLWSEYRDAYLFLLPWMIGFVVWQAGPMVASLYFSLTRYEIVTAPEWAGLEQYARLFQDDRFYLALYNSAFYVLIGVPTHLLLALGAAMLLNVQVKGTSFYRTLYYLPSIIPIVANSLLWAWMFSSEYGLVNQLLGSIGLPQPQWLQDPTWAKPALIVMSWWTIGGQMVILLAGLQGVPDHLYEAAAIDGAGAWHRFWAVTLPLLTPSLFFNLIVALIGAFQVFTQAYVMTKGGPQFSTLFYILYLYQNAFEDFKMGYASALAWVLFVIILVITLLQFKVANRWVFYEGELRR
jgi:multiple sugar transport system permease protein